MNFTFAQIPIGSAQRWSVIGALVLADTVLCVNTVESGVAKLPICVLGVALAASLFMTECILSRSVTITVSAITLLLSFHAALFLVSAYAAFDPVYTWGALALAVSCLVYYYAGAAYFPSKRDVEKLFTVVEWLTVVLCTIGAVQLIAGERLPVNFHISSSGRVSSLLGHSGFFSAFLIIVFPLILGRTLERRSGGGNVWLRFAFLAVIVVLLIAAQTRSSIAGWAVSLAVFAVIAGWAGWAGCERRTRYAVLTAVLLPAAVCAYAALIRPDLVRQAAAALDEGRGSTLARRTVFWNAGRDAFADSSA